MSDMKKLNDEALTNVTGGRTRYVQNDAGANVRSGPGTRFGKWYHLDEGDPCYTNGERVYNDDDGYDDIFGSGAVSKISSFASSSSWRVWER